MENEILSGSVLYNNVLGEQESTILDSVEYVLGDGCIRNDACFQENVVPVVCPNDFSPCYNEGVYCLDFVSDGTYDIMIGVLIKLSGYTKSENANNYQIPSSAFTITRNLAIGNGRYEILHQRTEYEGGVICWQSGRTSAQTTTTSSTTQADFSVDGHSDFSGSVTVYVISRPHGSQLYFFGPEALAENGRQPFSAKTRQNLYKINFVDGNNNPKALCCITFNGGNSNLYEYQKTGYTGNLGYVRVFYSGTTALAYRFNTAGSPSPSNFDGTLSVGENTITVADNKKDNSIATEKKLKQFLNLPQGSNYKCFKSNEPGILVYPSMTNDGSNYPYVWTHRIYYWSACSDYYLDELLQ